MSRYYLNVCRSPRTRELRLPKGMRSGSGEGRQVVALLRPGHAREVRFGMFEFCRQGQHKSFQASRDVGCAAARPSSVPHKRRNVR